MSFRNSFSSDKKVRVCLKSSASGLTHKPSSIFDRFFSRNVAKGCIKQKPNNIKKYCQFSDNKSKDTFLWDFELEIIYTGNVLRQRIDQLNRGNLTQQLSECARLICKRLDESQMYLESLGLDTEVLLIIRNSLDKVTLANQLFTEWTENLSSTDSVDQTVGQSRFCQLETAARSFIDLIKVNIGDIIDGDKKKRRSIDNGSLMLLNTRAEPSYISRFNEEDRDIIEKLKKLEQDIDQAPPKPQLGAVNQQSLDEYLNKIEDIVRAESEPIYEYSEISNNEVNMRKSVKVENNCIMATSMTSNDIPTVDGEAIQPDNDYTPTPDSHTQNNINVNGLTFNNFTIKDTRPLVNCRRSMPERDRNMPLPPVPIPSKVPIKFRSTHVPSSFHSEQHHHRKKSLATHDRSQVTNSLISNFSHQSPLRSPSFVSNINLQSNRSSVTQSPTTSIANYNDNYLKSPTAVSHSSEDGPGSHNLVKSRHLLMSKQIPNVVADPNQLLNISDMKDDIDIVSRSLNSAYNDSDNSKRLSNCSSSTTRSLPLEAIESKPTSSSLVTSTDNDGTIYNSEVKSDTEEYFEYFEIDGKKYRRKMKKRTVIEKIKIQKTVYAPLKPDGSGPDFAKLDEDNHDMIDGDTSESRPQELGNTNDPLSDNDQPILRRSTEDRFRVCRSMFLPHLVKNNRPTPNKDGDNNNERVSKTPALLDSYMYRFGQSDFEVPVIDKRLSTQLLDDVNSAWMKTSEFDLPHEKSKSICYFKKFRQKNEEGNTVHSAFRITTSRTVRMKPQDNVTQSTHASNVPAITISGEEDLADDEESDDGVGKNDSSCSSQYESFLPSTDEEKDVDSTSSQDSERGETMSTTSTMDDSDYHDSLIDEPTDVVPDLSERSPTPDSCSDSSNHSSYLSDTKVMHSFILKENNPNPYLIFDAEAKLGECDIAGGPVDALIVHACDGKDHLLFLGAFLDTYRTFIEPEDLINRLIIRYKYFRSKITISATDSVERRTDSGIVVSCNDTLRTSRKTSPDDDPEKKCIHILSLLLTIIGKLKSHERIHAQLQMFEKYLLDINEEQWIHAIKNTIKTQKISVDKDMEMIQILNKLSTRPQSLVDLKSPIQDNVNSPSKLVPGFLSTKSTLLDYSSREVAEQMTLLDWGRYRDVELIEVLNLTDIANCKLPGVIEYAKHFQNVRYWTQSVLLDPDKKTTSDRDRYCLKFLRIMKYLRKLCNFSSLIAILLAIQLLPIKKLFSKRVRSKIMEMDDYMKPTRFLGYKDDLKQAMAPCIPFLGLFYQDIVMLNIANSAHLDLEELINANRSSIWRSSNYQHLLSISEQCGPIINFWRSFKQYLFLKNCNKDQDKIRYSIEPNEKVLQFLNNFQEKFDESTIQQLAKQA